MSIVTFPVGLLLDDAGALLTGAAAVTIATVTDKAGGAIATPGATVNTGALPFISVDYDPDAKGEAIITLAVSQAGRTVTGANASPAIYTPVDSSRQGEIHSLLGKNSGVRDSVGGANPTSYNLFLYDTAAHAATNDGTTGMLHQYTVTNTYDGSSNLITSVSTRVS